MGLRQRLQTSRFGRWFRKVYLPTRTRSEWEEYHLWREQNLPTQAELEHQRASINPSSVSPVISLLTPVYNPPPTVLQEAIDSIVDQTYPRWEICLVDGNSSRSGVSDILKMAAAKDDRVVVKLLDENRGISGNSNAALEMATGDFILLFDHDDVLEPNALFEIAKAIAAHPVVDILYYDEDRFDAHGNYNLPYMKPKWSPELLLSTNYLMHSVIRRSLAREVGGFDSETDGAQDWDLIFRCTEQTTSERIVHIPKVLYHWRQSETSTATSIAAKPWAVNRQPGVVAAHLQRLGCKAASVTNPSPGQLRVAWQSRSEKVSVVIVTSVQSEFDSEHLNHFLENLSANTLYPDFEVVFVHDGENDALSQVCKKWEPHLKIKLVFASGRSYTEARNKGARVGDGSLLLFLHDDVIPIESDWMAELALWAERPGIGVVGGKMLRHDGTIDHAGTILGMNGLASSWFVGVPESHIALFYRNHSAVSDACLMVRRDVWESVGGWDEQFEGAYAEVDFCLRTAQQGYRTVYNPFVHLRHTSQEVFIPHHGDARLLFQRIEPLLLTGDPYLNPAYSTACTTPTFVKPGEMSTMERVLSLMGQPA